MEKEIKTQVCYVCGNEFQGPDPDMCCENKICMCAGIPSEPDWINPFQVLCSIECYNELMKPDPYHNEPLPQRNP